MDKEKIIEIEDGACYLWLQNMLSQQLKESERYSDVKKQKDYVYTFLSHLYKNVLPLKIVDELKNVENIILFLNDRIQSLIINNYNYNLKSNSFNTRTEELINRIEIDDIINKKFSCLYEKLLRTNNL